MTLSGNQALTLGGILTALAAFAHLLCIVIGAPAYRFLGAGERMARAAEAGSWRPTVITLAITLMLGIWAAYAFAAAGHLRPLPMMRWVVSAIAAIYLLRAFAFPWLIPAFPGNSMPFWWTSSTICLLLGLLHAYGIYKRW